MNVLFYSLLAAEFGFRSGECTMPYYLATPPHPTFTVLISCSVLFCRVLFRRRAVLSPCSSVACCFDAVLFWRRALLSCAVLSLCALVAVLF